MRRDLNKMPRSPVRKDENPMDQYMGEISTKSGSQQTPTSGIEVEAVVKKATDIIDHDKMNKVGFVVLAVVLLVTSGYLALNGNYVDAIGGFLFVVLNVILLMKVKVHHSEDSNYYLANATTTLRAMFRHYKLSKKIMDNYVPIMSWSIVLMIVEHLILRWFLFSPLSSTLYSLGFYGLGIGVVMAFSQRDTKSAHRALTFAFAYFVFSILFTAFFNQELYYFTIITAMLIWLISGWLKNCAIKDVKM